MTSRPFDIIVFGATGFTGQLVVEQLAKVAPSTLKWAISGRDKAKLEQVKASALALNPDLKEKLEIVIADVKNKESIEKMVKSTRVVADLAGPFTFYGPPVVEACVKFSTDYCDITGEVPFVKDNIDKYHKLAQEKGSLIVSMCGFDSIPSDLGTFFVVNHIKEKYKRKTKSVSAGMSLVGGFSGGTLETATSMKDTKWLQNPFILAERKLTNKPIDVYFPTRHADLGWVAPFFMSPVNVRVTNRSASLLEYGDDFHYREFLLTKNIFSTILNYILLIATFFVISTPLNKIVKKMVPPGTGPSKATQESGHWTWRGVGYSQTERGEKGVRVRGLFKHNKDPGYGSTSIMLAEAALCLALQRSDLPKGGVLTPASAMGKFLIDRLKKRGFTFAIEKEEDL